MSNKYHIHFFLCIVALFICTAANSQGTKSKVPLDPSVYCVDSIMDNVSFYAPFYKTAITQYDADLYIKTKLDIIRKNLLIRYLPSMFRPKHGMREYILETYNDLHFKAPDIYNQKELATTS